MRRILILTALILVVLLSGSVPASAVVSAAAHTDGSCAVDCLQGDVLEMRGFISCTAGMSYLIRANLRQNGQTAAAGRASGTCTGSEQAWSTTRVRNLGQLVCGDPFVATGQARTTNDGAKLSMPANAFSVPC